MASALVTLTMLIHMAGLAVLIALMRVHGERFASPIALINQGVIVIGVAFGLFALHTAEIWAYAWFYDVVGAMPTFEEALYFSTVTYSTVGYGDLTMARPWRVLGAIEGVNGIILLGWSTAFFVSVVNRIRTLEHVWTMAAPGGRREAGPEVVERQEDF